MYIYVYIYFRQSFQETNLGDIKNCLTLVELYL